MNCGAFYERIETLGDQLEMGEKGERRGPQSLRKWQWHGLKWWLEEEQIYDERVRWVAPF